MTRKTWIAKLCAHDKTPAEIRAAEKLARQAAFARAGDRRIDLHMKGYHLTVEGRSAVAQ